MARGEQDGGDPRAIGWAIGGVFAIGCLCAWLIVAMVNDDPDPVPLVEVEPFPGAEHVFGALNWRGCALGTDPNDPADLSSRGYTRLSHQTGQSLPAAIDTSSLDGSCGVVAVQATSGSLTSGFEQSEDPAATPARISTCMYNLLVIPTCGGEVHVTGSGLASVGVFAMPGVDAAALETTGLTLNEVLAHAEAEHLLAAAGFVASDEFVAESGSTVTPPAPTSGCVPYVFVGRFGGATTFWMGRHIQYSTSPNFTLTGIVSCAHGRVTEVSGNRSSLEGTARPYSRGGPAGSTPIGVATFGTAREVSYAALSLPTAEPDVGAP